MPQQFPRVAILGLGLMGASLGMALRAAGLSQSVAGYDAVAGVAERARALGAVDVASAGVADAVAGADLVVLAAPVLAIRSLLAQIAPYLVPHAIVTDVGSTKAEMVAWAGELLPAPERFVGGHPMAGREQSGVEAAESGLYRGCTWCLTPTPHTATAVLQRVQDLVADLGARPYILEPERHDAAVAAVSHLPLLAATALVLTAANSPAWSDGRALAAGGFRDTTRVASGDPHMARDICLTNSSSMLACLDAYIAVLQGLRARIAAGDVAIEATFQDAKSARDTWCVARAVCSDHAAKL
jgi:prephenate dehydrogenase